MCGIYASISSDHSYTPCKHLIECLRKRGPDHSDYHGAEIAGRDNPVFLSVFSTVLALRGGHVTQQPLVDSSTGSVLCWNGEAWRITGNKVTGNDGEAVLSMLLAATQEQSSQTAVERVLEALRSIEGPFAFVFFDSVHGVVFYGRDCLGRRSLLHNSSSIPGAIQLSSISVAPHTGWLEVEADGIYMIDCQNTFSCNDKSLEVLAGTASSFPIFRFRWSIEAIDTSTAFSLGKLNPSLPCGSPVLSVQSQSVIALETELEESLRLRVLNIPDASSTLLAEDARLAVLFSGGLDCTVLARMAHDLVPPDQSIDLLNVAFENPRVVQALKKTQPGSDGIASFYEACPDRITGRNAFRELQIACPTRTWRFVEVNVPYAETIAHRDEVISLIHPHNTEMDLSIAYALYFAARGTGNASTHKGMSPGYDTTARVLLSGLGADELFGGYTRHLTAFSRQGYKGLINELELDVSRLGKRNMGRDDRVISNWGREARFPFLDENLVKWALDCPVWEKCGFGSEQGSSGTSAAEDDIEPGKKVLRLLAQKLNLPTVAREKKRAIQFGARTAKMETGRTKGTTLVS